MASNRRSFLKTAGMAAAVTSAVPLGLGLGEESAPRVQAAPNPRLPGIARFALELDGVVTDWLTAYHGGFPFGKVAEFQDGSGGPPNKLLSGVGFDDIVLQVSSDLSPTLLEWIAEMVSGEADADSKKDGAIIAVDFNSQAQSRLEFVGGLITEVTFPAVDAASKDLALLTIVISPESTEFKPGGGELSVQLQTKQKKWLASNFRLTVGDLPTQRVNKVEALTVKQAVIEFNDGTTRIPTKEPGKLEFPNLAFTLSSSDSTPWFAYFKQFVLLGDGEEKQGSLEYLGPDLSPIFAVTLHNLGIFRCQPEHKEPADNVARTSVEMYMEGLTLGAVQ